MGNPGSTLGDSSLDLGIEMTLCDLGIDYIQNRSGFDLGDYSLYKLFDLDVEVCYRFPVAQVVVSAASESQISLYCS